MLCVNSFDECWYWKAWEMTDSRFYHFILYVHVDFEFKFLTSVRKEI